MKISKARIVAGSGVVLTAVAVIYAIRPKPMLVETAVVERGALETTVEADGRTRVRQRYMVSAPVAGRVERLDYTVGAVVRVGEVVAQLTPPPLDSQMLIQARARVTAAAALALAAGGQSRVTTAALEQRRRELARAVRLAEVGGVAARVVEDCQLAVIDAEESARGSLERLRAAEADHEQMRALLIGTVGGGRVLVRAPATGRVLRILDRNERVVSASTPLVEIGDPASIEVVIDVLSSEAPAIHAGDVVRLAEWGGETSNEERTAALTGHVRDVEPAGFARVSALGVDEQRVNVIVDLERTPPSVGDGFRVEASIVVWSANDVLVVPRGALIQPSGERGSWRVFVVSSGRVEARPVRIGHQGSGAAEVLGGLAAGDEVILFPSDRITDGARVKARKT